MAFVHQLGAGISKPSLSKFTKEPRKEYLKDVVYSELQENRKTAIARAREEPMGCRESSSIPN